MERRVLLTKGNMISLLAFSQFPDGTLIGSYDERSSPPIRKCFAPFGDEKARSFDIQLEKTKDNGWRVVADVIPNNPTLS